MAILVNVAVSGATAHGDDEIRSSAAGDWVIAERSLQLYGDVLVAVRKNIVVGVWDIERWTRSSGKVRFTLSPAPDHHALLGQPSPVEWTRGQANPVKFCDLGQHAPTVHHLRTGSSRVTVNGWTLTVLSDGRARVHSDANDGRKVMVQSVYPGPGAGNVTLGLVHAGIEAGIT